MNFKFFKTIIILIILSETEAINPFRNPSICGRPECYDANTKFKYLTTKVYRYDYKLNVKTEFHGSGQNKSDLYLTGNVELSFPKLCQGVLKLNSLELRESVVTEEESTTSEEYDTEYVEPQEIELHENSVKFAEDMERYELKFAFQDGVIGEVCPDENEPVWTLNLKKGILSTLQNSMVRFDVDYNTTETDISGKCDVVYTLTETSGTSLIIKKFKDITSCKYRYKTNTIFQTTPYEFRQNYAAWPILKSHSYCNLSVDHNIYNNIRCFERHQLVPFSNQQYGAVTESFIELKLSDEETLENYDINNEEGETILKRSHLLFDHTPSPRVPHGEIKSARDLLIQMCNLGFPDIQRGFPDVFTNFLSTAKLLSYTALQQLLNRAPSICANGKNHVLESLPYISSSASVEIMKEQIVKNQIPSSIALNWMTSLSFIRRPDTVMLDAMLSLIQYGKERNVHRFTLGASAITHTFCTQHTDCGSYPEVELIVKYLENDILSHISSNNRKERERVVVSLKALGNIGIVSEPFETELKTIIENPDVLLEVRLEAIKVFRRLDCELSKNYFMDLYGNYAAQVEIRIQSYLQIMNCPDYISINRVLNILENEAVNQVGSFVWSHLNNLAKSSSPVRVATQGLLVGANIPNKFKLDIRKFSRNYERSVFFDEYNFGGNLDSNLIFGTDSYLPRTLSFNLTFDLFGESVNMFEMNTRMQGFEKFVESYFGPKGPVSTQRFIKKYDAFTNYVKHIFSGDSIPSLRELSEINDPKYLLDKAVEMKDNFDEFNSDDEDNEYLKEETNELHSQSQTNKNLQNKIDGLNYHLKYNYNEPRAAFGIKVFGNDLIYETVEGASEVFATASNFNPQSLTKLLSDKEISYTKSGLLLDASYVVPLSSGLPLSLSTIGVSSVDVRLSGLWKTPGFKKTKQIDIEAKIKPSISVDVLATMESDFFHGSSGIKLKTNVYSSSAIETKIKIRGTRLISFQVSLPQDRNEIFSAKSEMLVMKYKKDIPQTGINKRQSNTTCTWPAIDKAVGLKICTDYQLPDVSNSTIYPSLILSGPVVLDIHLDKADLTAKTFVVEYRSQKIGVESQKSLIFETPGSMVLRKLSANVTSNEELINVTMSFEHGDQRHYVIGSYKNTPNIKHLELALHLNGERNIALEIGLNKTEIANKNGAVFYPTFFVIVNKDKIAGLTGVVKKTEKNDKTQYDVDLTFETKKLQSKMKGFVSKTEASWSTNMNFNYMFSDTQLQQIRIEGDFADRSQKGRTELIGNFKHQSTAYPGFNFVSHWRIITALGHIETKLDINNAPDFKDPRFNLGLKLMFARSQDYGLSRTKASVELLRPISKIDLKFLIKHDEKFKNGAENNLLVVVRYAPNKEATAIISVYHPQGIFYGLDATLNATAPGFSPCTASLVIQETTRKDYKVNFKATWFTAHSININGFYQDRSSAIKVFHHIKLIVQSPSFDETTLDVRYARDEFEFKIETQVNYGNDPYAVVIKNVQSTLEDSLSYAELKWKEQMYWISANMRSGRAKQLTLEIHIDRDRDIHLNLKGLSEQLKREFGIEIKWDANRDPTQRIALSAYYNTPIRKNYNGGFFVTYPNRTFNGEFNVYLNNNDYRGNSRLSWSPQEIIQLSFLMGGQLREVKKAWLQANLKTPFQGWENNLIDSNFYYYKNKLILNSTMIWAESQNLAGEFFTDYEITHENFNFEVKIGLNSTLKEVPSINAYALHNQTIAATTTDFTIKKQSFNETLQIYSIRSKWNFDNDYRYRNITGSVAIKSPYEGYQNGALVSKLSLNTNKKLLAAADFELENQKYTLVAHGHIKKITDNMLIVNITTPIEKFRQIICRFGVNERDKHLVAEVRAPETALGIEILFSAISSTDFNIKFNLETPLEAFEKVMLIGKMKPKTVDFRGAWNKFILGFIGVWRYENSTDFEYSYKVFTPLKSFEENGVVARFIENNHNFEISVKLAKYKAGLLLLGQSKPKVMDDLGLKEPFKLFSDLFEDKVTTNVDQADDYDENDYVDDYEEMNFSGYMELDLIIYPTIKGDFRIIESDFTYLSYGNLHLPQGTVNFKDRFYYPDMLTIKNELIVFTPFEKAKQITSVYQSSIAIFKEYTIGLDVSFLYNSNLLESGFFFNFTNSTDDSDLRINDIVFNIKTPLDNIPRMNTKIIIETEDNVYRANFTGRTMFTVLSLAVSLEHDLNFVDTTVGFSLSTPLVPHYSCKVYFKKDFSEIENTLDMGFELNDNSDENKLRLETMWHIEQPDYINAKLKFHTNLLPLEVLQGSVLVSKTTHPMATFEISCIDHNKEETKFKARLARKKDLVTFDMNTPLPDFKNVSIAVTLAEQTKQGTYKVAGSLYRNYEIYYINGDAEIIGDIPLMINIVLRPNKGGSSGALTYSWSSSPDGNEKQLQMKVYRADRFLNVDGNFYTRNKLNWKYLITVKSSEKEIDNIKVDITTLPDAIEHQINGKYEINTPWKYYGVNYIYVESMVRVLQSSGEVSGKYELSHVKSYGKCSWSWIQEENMHILLESRTNRDNHDPKMFEAGAKFINPNKSFKNLSTGANINVNSIWKISTNGTLTRSSQDLFNGLITVVLPAPAAEVHRISGKYFGLKNDNRYENIDLEVKYESDIAKQQLSGLCEYRNDLSYQPLVLGRIVWGPDQRNDALESNFEIIPKGRGNYDFSARLATPFHQEDSLLANGSFGFANGHNKYFGIINIPASKHVADANIDFTNLSNTKGNFNFTTPFLNISWFKTEFDFSSNGQAEQKFIKGIWPNDTATFESKTKLTTNKNTKDLEGEIQIEVPIQTRHFIKINYDLLEKSKSKLGNATVDYNQQRVLDGKYKFVSEIRNGIEKDVVDITLENAWKPLGVHYIHTYDDKQNNVVINDVKRIEIFDLNKTKELNITTEFYNFTTPTGQEFKLIAIHPNRTVTLTVDYDNQDNNTKQKSKLQLATDVWIAYDFNATQIYSDDSESQIFALKLSYPSRNISAEGWYEIKETAFDSNVEFKWIKNIVSVNDYDYQFEDESKPRIMSAKFLWHNYTKGNDDTNHTILFGLLHPSFEKNVTFKGTYYKDPIDMFKTEVKVDYCHDPEHLLTFGINAKDLTSITGYRNYSLHIFAYHNISELELDAGGTIGVSPGIYSTKHNARYKRGYLPLQEGTFIVKLNTNENEIDYYKSTPNKNVGLRSKADGAFPVYTVNGSYLETPSIDSAGRFYLNFDTKYVELNLNMTPDGTQNLQLLGLIPDARSASFDIHRNYEDIRVTDITSYIRMNHSRLVTSRIYWRPTIKSEIKTKIREHTAEFYDSLSEGLDFWKKTIQIELIDSCNDIWMNAKPYTQEFLNDVSTLSVIDNDITELRGFLNKSYTANDFYIRSVVNFTLIVLDELALKQHIETVPKILRELIQSMGDSGKALKESIDLFVETVKSSYQNIIQMIGRLFHGETFEHLSVLMENAVAKYDKWIKDLHLTFIKHVENLYTKITHTISSSWQRMLQNIEPTIMTFAHYIETAIWKFSKEIFDFLYQRSTELTESPYFNQVSNFTKDLDRFYKDIMSNDAITNVKKYSALGWQFLKEKYFKIIPFGKELHNVLSEIYNEIKQLQNLEAIQFITNKYTEIQNQIQWIAEELQIEERLQQILTLLKNKLARYAQTALQADSKYREAKTKFIFNPTKGILELEQKLPMSWHAFNETPKFEEIPEYKMINDVQKFLSGGNDTIWSFYHELKPFMEPTNWLPPFKARAFLLGSRHYITFDQKFISLDLKYEVIDPAKSKPNQCSYLLARDHFNENFTMVIEPMTIVNSNNEIVASRKFTLLAHQDLISFEILGDTIRIENNVTSLLPIRLKDVLIHRDADVLTIDSKNGFTIICNMQFDYCSLELAGWYFGKTAGLLGTMNNENYDEYFTAQNKVAINEQEFVNSWQLPGCEGTTSVNKFREVIGNASYDIIKTCDMFFKSKSSYFSTCFTVINPLPFFEMCLDLGMNSMSKVMNDNHPSQKGMCTAALAYIDVCDSAQTPLRVPDTCVHCDLINGSYVPEGSFVTIQNDDITQTTDVVFIVEAKPCNTNITISKSLNSIISSIHKELIEANITNNRYGVIAFGGKSPFDVPRSIIYNSDVFTFDHRNLIHYFNHIKTTGGKNNDIFEAISIASKLIFRPGASKSFILLPCSKCLHDEMDLDYSSLLQLLLENGINLHVLMNDDFIFDKARFNKQFFGIDRQFAFSKKDFKELKGNSEIRKQIRLPKSTLGVCAPLAIETNGSVFTARKLRPDKRNPVMKLSTVFAKRVALTAKPNDCQTCECTGHNTGVAYMQCYPCSFPNPEEVDGDYTDQYTEDMELFEGEEDDFDEDD